MINHMMPSSESSLKINFTKQSKIDSFCNVYQHVQYLYVSEADTVLKQKPRWQVIAKDWWNGLELKWTAVHYQDTCETTEKVWDNTR